MHADDGNGSHNSQASVLGFKALREHKGVLCLNTLSTVLEIS